MCIRRRSHRKAKLMTETRKMHMRCQNDRIIYAAPMMIESESAADD
jgi:hypothetical protein